MARVARVMAMPTKRAMAVATRAAGDEEGDGEGSESDGDGDKEGDGEEEVEGPRSSSSPDRLPPRHMLPLLLRLATAFRAIVGAALRCSFGISSAAAFASAVAPRRRVGPRRGRRQPIRVNDDDALRQHSRDLFFCLFHRLPRHNDDERCGAPVVRNRPDGRHSRVRLRLHYLMR
jgi:hypothetical protein